LAEITASHGVSSVEVCDSAGECTRQEFGAPAVNVLDYSFTIRVPDTGSSTVLTLRGFGANGSVLASGEAESSFGKSERMPSGQCLRIEALPHGYPFP